MMGKFYNPCTDCGKMLGADLADTDGTCPSCRIRYRDESYARKIDHAIESEFDSGDMFWWHMGEVMKLCFKANDKKEERSTITFSQPIKIWHRVCAELRYFEKEIQFHLDVTDALLQKGRASK